MAKSHFKSTHYKVISDSNSSHLISLHLWLPRAPRALVAVRNMPLSDRTLGG